MSGPRILAVCCAALALALCLVVEHALLTSPQPPTLLIPGLLDLRYAWNHGVSFSLLRQDSVSGIRLLSAALAVMVLVLAVLAWRARNRLVACGLGFIIGGAISNLIDRQTYGTVFDFLAVHIGAWPLFICNTADLAISLGVILLVWDSLFAATATPKT